jgi:hypothetical protein
MLAYGKRSPPPATLTSGRKHREKKQNYRWFRAGATRARPLVRPSIKIFLHPSSLILPPSSFILIFFRIDSISDGTYFIQMVYVLAAGYMIYNKEE